MHVQNGNVATRAVPLEAQRWSSVPDIDIPEFDLRTRRDLLGRRIWREALRRTARLAVLIFADIAAAAAALAAAIALVPTPGTEISEDWTGHAVPVAVLVILGLGAFGAYDTGRARRSLERIGAGLLAGTLAVAIFGRYGTVRPLSLAAYPTFFASAFILLAAGRLIADRLFRAIHHAGKFRINTLIIGGRDESWEVLEHIARSERTDLQVVGHLAPEPDSDPTALGGLDRLGEVIEARDIRNVIVSAQLPADRLRELVQECFHHGIAISVLPATLARIRCRISSRDLLGWPLIELEVPRLHLLQLIAKRVVDIIGAVVGLILLAPLFAIIAVLIKIQSPGPVLFRQMRPGLGGRTFPMLKFRTMRADAEEVLRRDPELYAKFIANDCKLPEGEDPRIFPIGRILRKWSVDELPQLINVLRGEMSLVGPRPVVGPELENYGDDAPLVLAVKPGMTGYWQINGRSTIPFPRRAWYDIYYVINWSLALDLKILLLTVPSVLLRRGAH
jgi:exopolysaccharide biosynthesis polyprenyl glycosylphosphotransferase